VPSPASTVAARKPFAATATTTFASLDCSQAKKKEGEKREKDWSATAARIKDLHVGFDFGFKFPILGISNLKTHPIYWIWLHLLIPLVELLQ